MAIATLKSMRRTALAAAALLSLMAGGAVAQTLKISGIAADPVELSLPSIEAVGLTEVRDARLLSAGGQTEQREIVYQGVTLPRLLDAAGFDRLDRYRLRAATIIVVAKDGYRASFSWGELFNSPAGERVLLVLRENGAVSAREGAFSLRSLNDLRPGPRHVRDVAEIRVVLP